MREESRFPRILLLGASGKLGRAVRAIWSDTLDYVSVSRRATDGCLHWGMGDPFPDIGRFDAVLALWGVTSNQGNLLSDNAILAEHALVIASEVGARRVVHCSSAAVYEGRTGPLREEMTLSPVAAYGRSKLEMERRIAEWHRAHPEGPESVVLRIGNVVGADSLFANLIPGETVTLDRFADGEGPVRSYLSPHDLALILYDCACQRPPERLYNLASSAPTAMADIARAAGCRVAWREATRPEVQRVHLDTSRLQRDFGNRHLSGAAADLVQSARNSGIWP